MDLWRVIKIYPAGSVELISEYVSSEEVYFNGKFGFRNFTKCLNELASQYETDGITSGSRSFGYNGQTEFIADTSKMTTYPWGCSTNEECENAPVESLGGGDSLYLLDVDLVTNVLGTIDATQKGSSILRGYWNSSRAFYIDTYGSLEMGWSGSSTGENYGGNLLYGYNEDWISKRSSGYHFRPIVTFNPNVEITGGTGTQENPYQINYQ